jgi:hypothetical protein
MVPGLWILEGVRRRRAASGGVECSPPSPSGWHASAAGELRRGKRRRPRRARRRRCSPSSTWCFALSVEVFEVSSVAGGATGRPVEEPRRARPRCSLASARLRGLDGVAFFLRIMTVIIRRHHLVQQPARGSGAGVEGLGQRVRGEKFGPNFRKKNRTRRGPIPRVAGFLADCRSSMSSRGSAESGSGTVGRPRCGRFAHGEESIMTSHVPGARKRGQISGERH